MDLAQNARRAPATLSMLVLLACCLLLAACGGSSPAKRSSSPGALTSVRSSSTSSTSASPAPPRLQAVRACLQKQGITLPEPGSEAGPRGEGAAGRLLLGAGAGPAGLPKGVTASRMREALMKCRPLRSDLHRLAPERIRSPVFRQVLSSFAVCMRHHGVTLPTPNSSGSGPVFDTRGLNTHGVRFRAAVAQCGSLVRSALRGGFRRPGAAG